MSVKKLREIGEQDLLPKQLGSFDTNDPDKENSSSFADLSKACIRSSAAFAGASSFAPVSVNSYPLIWCRKSRAPSAACKAAMRRDTVETLTSRWREVELSDLEVANSRKYLRSFQFILLTVFGKPVARFGHPEPGQNMPDTSLSRAQFLERLFR
jgi:hypothetical protein